MDLDKYLILIKNEDKTENVRFIKYHGKKCTVTFSNINKTYEYNSENVELIKVKKQINVLEHDVYIKEEFIKDALTILDFEKIYRVIMSDGKSRIC